MNKLRSPFPKKAHEAKTLGADRISEMRGRAEKGRGMPRSTAAALGRHSLGKTRRSMPCGMAAKLTQTMGDSFAETMVAFLVAALGTALLATMIITASNVISHNKEAIARVYEAEVAIAEGGPIAEGQEATISSAELGGTHRVPIDIYEDGGLTRYIAAEAEGAP